MFDPVTFTKGDATKVAESPRQAVQLRFDGWIEAAPDLDPYKPTEAEIAAYEADKYGPDLHADSPLKTTVVETPDTV